MRLMIETAMRAGEGLALSTDDVDLSRGLIVVRRGKGRVVPISPAVTRSRWTATCGCVTATGWLPGAPSPRVELDDPLRSGQG